MMKKNKINPKVNSLETFIKYYLPKYYKKNQEEEEHKCWYCMTDIEKNEWLKAEGFKIRYPLVFAMDSRMTAYECDISLGRVYNPRELIPPGF